MDNQVLKDFYWEIFNKPGEGIVNFPGPCFYFVLVLFPALLLFFSWTNCCTPEPDPIAVWLQAFLFSFVSHVACLVVDLVVVGQ